MIRILKFLAFAAGIVLLSGVLLWSFFPSLASVAATRLLDPVGVEIIALSVDRPGMSRWRVERVAFAYQGWQVEVGDVDIAFTLDSLASKRATHARISTVVAKLDTGVPTTPGEMKDPLEYWTGLPVDRLAAESISISVNDPAVLVVARLEMDPATINLAFDVEGPVLPAPMAGLIVFDQASNLGVTVGERDGPVVLEMSGAPVSGRNLEFSGKIDLDERTFALLTPLLDLPRTSGDVNGTFTGQVSRSAAFTPLWNTLTVSGALDVGLRVPQSPLGEELKLVGALEINLKDGTVTFGSPSITLSANSVTAGDGVQVSGLRFKGDLTGSYPLRMQAPSSTTDATIRSEAFELIVGSVHFDGADYVIESGGSLKGDLDATLSLTGTAPANAAKGNIEFDLALSSDSESAISPYAAASGKLGFMVGDGMVHLNFDEGAAFGALLVQTDFEVVGLSPFAVRWQIETPSITLQPSQFSVRVPELSALGQRLSFRDARADVALLELSGNRLEVKSAISSNSSPQAVRLNISTSADIDARKGKFTIISNHTLARPLLRSELSGSRYPFDLDGGDIKLDASGDFDLNDPVQLTASGQLSITGGNATYEKTVVNGITTTLPFSLSGTDWSVGSSTVSIAAIDLGVPLSEIGFTIDANPRQVNLSGVRATLLEGDASVDAIAFDMAAGSSEFNVALNAISVAAVLALEGDDIVGTGTIDGILPVVMSAEGVAVSAGKLDAREPGGRLSYRGNLGATTAPGMDLAIKALRNFHYHTMAADVNYQPSGILTLKVLLAGKSPEVENGRPIHFNLNLTEDIPALLESLRAADSTTERVQERLSR